MHADELIDFVKAFADADRLRIIGVLTQKPARLSEIIEILGFHPADTQHHLDLLLQSGMVRRMDDFYELDTEALEKLRAGNSKESVQPLLRNRLWKRTKVGFWPPI